MRESGLVTAMSITHDWANHLLTHCHSPSPDRVGSRNDGAAGGEGGDDACLADADALLLHGLVDGHPAMTTIREME